MSLPSLEVSRFSADTGVSRNSAVSGTSRLSNLDRVLRVSSTMRRSFDLARPTQPWGLAFRFEYSRVSPSVWLCVGLSNGPLLFHTQWYYGADHQWFRLGRPIAVWKDAVLVECSVPGRIIIIPDYFYTERLPFKLRMHKAILSYWLPSLAGGSLF